MSNHLGMLRSPKGAVKKSKRIGRGQGSGKGGTSTRGHKGHQSRSGFQQIPNFEGGQMPFVRRVPKFGFHSPFRTEYQVLNLSRLQALAEAGKLADGAVTNEALYGIGAVSKRNKPVKILGNGELTAKLSVQVDSVSASARAKIEAAGGTVTVNE